MSATRPEEQGTGKGQGRRGGARHRGGGEEGRRDRGGGEGQGTGEEGRRGGGEGQGTGEEGRRGGGEGQGTGTLVTVFCGANSGECVYCLPRSVGVSSVCLLVPVFLC